MNYEQAIVFLQSFPDFERDPSINLNIAQSNRNLKMPHSAMGAFLKIIDNPQNTAKTIHVAGSKGKGSTATFITSILNAAGFKTALFTSPHIHSYTERIAFDLKPISKEDFAQGITDLKPFIENFEKGEKIFSTFGILTALFFYLANKAKPTIDWQIVEVGLGGTQDLTNVFDKKEIAVITPISLEHTDLLGNTIQSITENKAGIITPGCLTILSAQNDPAVEPLVKNICFKKNAQFIPVTQTNLPYKLKLPGNHQIANANTAITVIQALKDKGHKIEESSIKQGFSAAFLPVRFEIFETDTFALDRRSSNPHHFNTICVLDAAHNGDSANALAKTLYLNFSGRPILFIMGLNQDKNLEDIYFALKAQAKKIIITKAKSHRAMDIQEIHDRIRHCDQNMQIISTNNIDEAIIAASNEITSEDIICVCGSFYLAAEMREILLKGA